MLRPYQQDLKNKIYEGWQGNNRNICAVLPTGGGKTKIMASIAGESRGATAELAHRQELVSQISLALARDGIYHRIIAPDGVIRFISAYQSKNFGASFVHHGAPHAVISVDTINNRTEELARWMDQVHIWQCDECHHLAGGNKWAQAVSRFKNAWGVGWTAWPGRADRKLLGRAGGGVFDLMTVGPDMRQLIELGFLTDYVIFGPPPSYDGGQLDISKTTGDVNPNQLRDVAHKSTITGDIVRDYLRLTPGKRGVSFVVDVQLAAETVQAFEQAGVPAAMISAKTPDNVRIGRMDDFRNGFIKQMVNVDILGEGVDVPGIEVVSMGRYTESFSLFIQQFGRMLRILPGKYHGYLIDHVGNVLRHGIPDRYNGLTLEAPERRKTRKAGEIGLDLAIPLMNCRNPLCLRTFERIHAACPHCGWKPEPGGRDRPEQVDGDLTEYGPDLLRKLRGEADRIMAAPVLPTRNRGAASGALAQHNNRAAAQRDLRNAMAYWAGIQREIYDRNDSQSYRLFYHRFGIDTETAKTLGLADATKLTELLWKDMNT